MIDESTPAMPVEEYRPGATMTYQGVRFVSPPGVNRKARRAAKARRRSILKEREKLK